MVKALKFKNGNTWISFFAWYEITNESLNKEYTMASGKIVEDYVGFRKRITAEVDCVPQDVLTAFNSLVKQGFTQVQYIDDDGSTKTQYFKVQPFSPTVLKYDALNNPIWHNCVIEMEAQSV